MKEIAYAGIDTVIVSYWGPDSVEARPLPLILREARAQGLRVALEIDGRTTPELVGALVPGFVADGITDFYMYAARTRGWAATNADLPRGVRIFANTLDLSGAKRAGFSGVYTYGRTTGLGSYKALCKEVHRWGLLCAPSVYPGYATKRAENNSLTVARRDGRHYDAVWTSAVRADPDVIVVTSYNEWHQGTQIEPARRHPGFLSYEGAWGRTGSSAQRAYLVRTRYWARKLAASASLSER
jgi:Glycosyl hydrolase family 99